MSILVRGMEMPISCANCPLRCYDRDDQKLCGATGNAIRFEIRRPENCPLIEVPPHGRLIDGDAIINLVNNCMFPSDMVTTTALSMATNWIKEAPTVIGADGQDTNVPTREEGK